MKTCAAEIEKLIIDLVNLKDKAYRIGMYATARKLEDAEKAVGWEYADKITKRSNDYAYNNLKESK